MELYYPPKKDFLAYAEKFNLIPVYREVLADLETPVSCFLKLGDKPYSYLLESVEGGERMARYSFIGASYSRVLKGRKGHDPLAELEAVLKPYRKAPVAGLPPFSGGAVGYLGYDTVRYIEKIPDKNKDVYGLPESIFILSDTVLAFDHVQKKIKIICNVYLDGKQKPEEAYKAAERKIEAEIQRLRAPLSRETIQFDGRPAKPVAFRSNFSEDAFKKAVLKAKEHIKKGDVFQVVLSQAFSAPVKSKPFHIYRALRSINPSPYMFYLNCEDFQLVGSSPEVHVRCEDGKALLRPIAGTRPRGRDADHDKALEKELLADSKERAEHLMLVDLGRNDLGRVCEFKSVKVPEFMVIERYSHVMHIVSLVEGILKKGKTAFDLLRATFPAGTISGAPKVRAMEVIDALENQKRGFYSGVVGYFSFSGNLDSCITIRTILV